MAEVAEAPQIGPPEPEPGHAGPAEQLTRSPGDHHPVDRPVEEPASPPVDAATTEAAEVETSPGISAESPPAASGPRGRSHTVDWEMVDKEVFRLMDHNGEFIRGDLEWNAQARLEEAILGFCEKQFSKSPGENTIRTHVRKALKRWRHQRTEN
jgi:hypothetical protein